MVPSPLSPRTIAAVDPMRGCAGRGTPGLSTAGLGLACSCPASLGAEVWAGGGGCSRCGQGPTDSTATGVYGCELLSPSPRAACRDMHEPVCVCCPADALGLPPLLGCLCMGVSWSRTALCGGWSSRSGTVYLALLGPGCRRSSRSRLGRAALCGLRTFPWSVWPLQLTCVYSQCWCGPVCSPLPCDVCLFSKPALPALRTC